MKKKYTNLNNTDQNGKLSIKLKTMKNSNKQLFKFWQENGNWKCDFNTGYFVRAYTEHGFPFEMLIEEIEKMTQLQLLFAKLNSWKIFVKENKIDISQIKEDLFKKQDEIIPKLDEIIKLSTI